MTQDTALKLSRLPYDQQAEAASMLAAGTVESVEQYQQEKQTNRQKHLHAILCCRMRHWKNSWRMKKRNVQK